jgi:uncharacterized membrane protein SpoIIM required for sporulation
MTKTDQALAHWLQTRSGEWQRLHSLLALQQGGRTEDVTLVTELVQKFRALGADLALARKILPHSQVTRHLETLFAEAHGTLARKPLNAGRRIKRLFVVEIPEVMTRMRSYLTGTATLFILSLAAGWLLVNQYPDLASLFASEEMVNTVQRGELWTDGLLNIMPSSILALSIMTNNIAVTLFAFVLGALYGLGTLYIIGLNGLMLGGIFAFTRQHHLDDRLFQFVVAHGIVELSIICLAGAAGVRLGEALIRPGAHTRGQAFHLAVEDTAKLLPLCALFLIGAGLIEGYISPNDSYTLVPRLVIGVGYGILLWAALSGGLWKFGSRKNNQG